MKKFLERFLSIALVLAMCASLMNVTALAAEAGDKCPLCKTGIIVADKNNPKHLICTECAEYSEYIQDTKPECKHEKTYLKDNQDGKTHGVYCTACEQLVSTAQHSFTKGKCECGAQEPEHVHSWSNVTNFCNGTFKHTLTCSCGATKTEYNTGERTYDPWSAQNVYQCKYCKYFVPVTDVHNWETTGTHIEGTEKHTIKCGDAGCNETRTEDCKLVATQDGSGVYCTVCGWVKHNDGTPGGDESKYCKDGKHQFGNTYQHNDGYHWQQCMNCPYTTDHEQCKFDLEYKDGNIATAHVCSVCGNTKSVNDVPVCDPNNPTKGHDWRVNRTELAADGKTMLTIVKCANCGAEKVDGKCNSQEGFYKLTIHYQKPGGETVYPDVVKTLAKDAPYSVPSQPLHGYDVDYDVVAGNMPAGDEVITVKYTPHEYKWTIYYVDEQGNTLHDPSVQTYTVETVKGLTAPANPDVAGYQVKEVSITPPDPDKLGDVDGKVVYEPVTRTYTLTVNVYLDGELVEADSTSQQVAPGADIPEPSQTREGATFRRMEGYVPTMPEEDVTISVYFETVSESPENDSVTVNVYVDGVLVSTESNEFAPGAAIPMPSQTYPGADFDRMEGYVATMPNEGGVTINVYFVTADDDNPTPSPEPEPEPEPSPEPEPTPEPEPELDIDDPNVPLDPEPELDIEEPDVPLEPEPELDIEDPDVPLADVPETGDGSHIWAMLATLFGTGLAWLAVQDKKRRRNSL